MLNKRQIGTNKEKIAAEYLRVNGYEILEQNFYANNGTKMSYLFYYLNESN